jgi:hypothetical protein
MMSETSQVSSVIDFAAQTITTIDKASKTYSVKALGASMPAGAGKAAPQIDVKETGQTKTINGYNCTQTIMTLSVEAPVSAPPGAKMRVEMEIWMSADVPGWQSKRAFYEKNSKSFAIMAAGNRGAAQAVAEIQNKMAMANGVAVMQVIRVKSVGSDPQTTERLADMAQARARLDEIARQSGPESEIAKQALSRLPPAGAGAPLFETTMEAHDFSNADIPNSVFAIPAGFTQK